MVWLESQSPLFFRCSKLSSWYFEMILSNKYVQTIGSLTRRSTCVSYPPRAVALEIGLRELDVHAITVFFFLLLKNRGFRYDVYYMFMERYAVALDCNESSLFKFSEPKVRTEMCLIPIVLFKKKVFPAWKLLEYHGRLFTAPARLHLHILGWFLVIYIENMNIMLLYIDTVKKYLFARPTTSHTPKAQ